MEKLSIIEINGREYSIDGESAYEVAVRNGFEGTEAEWLESLIGRSGVNGENGAKGDSVFIRYSYYADGTDFTEAWDGQEFIGFATGETAPTDKSAYTWALFIDRTDNTQLYQQMFANSLVGNVQGTAVSMDDVASDGMAIVNLRSKNLIPYPYKNPTETKNGVTFTDNGDGSITINGTPTALTSHILAAGKFFSRYVICKLGGSFTEDGLCISLTGDKNADVGFAFETNVGQGGFLYLLVGEGNTYDNVTVYPQLEYGTVATPYTPYVPNDKAVTVKSCGKNLLQYPYKKSTETVNGITFTDNGDGSITVNGTATSQAQYIIIGKADNFILPAGTYTVSGMPVTTESIAIYTSKGQDWGNKITKYYDGTETFFINITVNKGATADNLVIYPQLEYGTTATAYELYIEGETKETYIHNDINVLSAIAPNMTITTDNSGVILDVDYKRDTNIAYSKLENRLAELEKAIVNG